MDNRGINSVFVILLITLVPILAADSPALIWSPSRPMTDLPKAFMGNKVSAGSFHSDYLLPLSKESRSVIIFLQDKLGLNHLSQYGDIYKHSGDGGVFRNVKRFMEESFSTNLASVNNPMAAVEGLKKKFLDSFVEVHNPLKIASMKLSTDKSHLFLVHLPNLLGASNEAVLLRHNDNLIAKTLKDLTERGFQYSAVLTGMGTDKEDAESNYLGRHLLQMKEPSGQNSTPIYLPYSTCPFYAEGISLIVANGPKNQTRIPFTNLTSHNASCTKTSASYTFTLQSVTPPLTANFILDISANSSNWNVDEFSVEYELNGTAYNVNLKTQNIYAPKVFSYHCTKVVLLQTNATSGKNTNVEFLGLQVQPFDGRNGTFTNNVWDCTGFFTIGIWMGLISTLILGIILAFGLCMITDIKTMDRFDDPKGKMFSVPVMD
ncbi:V-type proton ATPase subunit S1-like [Argonauta hians]